jgi:hypothetical protein
MHIYDFEVLFDGAVIAAEHAVRLVHVRAACPEVERLARAHDARGAKIRVTDETGRIVVLTGVASVLRHAQAKAA